MVVRRPRLGPKRPDNTVPAGQKNLYRVGSWLGQVSPQSLRGGLSTLTMMGSIPVWSVVVLTELVTHALVRPSTLDPRFSALGPRA